ncbi:MAG: FUSC family protein [Roseiarcus sp.]
MSISLAFSRRDSRQASALTAAAPLLFALRLWASVCLALYIAFWLQLDNPFWAGTSAAIVCQPQLGAALRKGWFRMIGTVIGATMIVTLTALFPQDRIGFLALLAVWASICAFIATLLRNFASYGAALAGYTAAIIAADTLGATGGASSEVFWIAVWRASEICIGIACAGLVLGLTDLGGAQRRLAASFASLAAEVMERFTRTLALAGPQVPDTLIERRELVRRVIALDPMIDQALGESGHARTDAPTLQTAVYGLIRALDGWRGVARHLTRSRDERERQEAATILRSIPPELRSATEPGASTRWLADPMALRRLTAEAASKLLALPAGTPSLRLLADETAKVVAGMSRVLDGLALLVDAPDRSPAAGRGFSLGAPDWLPAHISAARAFVTIGAVELFWVATAWPNGGSAIVFAAVTILLLSPRGDLAFGAAIAFALGTAGSVFCAAIIKFALLPALATFPAFCVAIGLILVPASFAMAWAQSRQKLVLAAVFTPLGVNFLPLLAPTNQMTYDTGDFYNTAMAIAIGCCIAPLAFSLIPPLSPEQRTRRLLAGALRDLRRLATASKPSRLEDWESRMYGRVAAVPDQAEPLQRARLMTALSVGREVIQLREIAVSLASRATLDAAFGALARGNGATAKMWLKQLDDRLAAGFAVGTDTVVVLRARSRILAICEALSAHAAYFDEGAIT